MGGCSKCVTDVLEMFMAQAASDLSGWYGPNLRSLTFVEVELTMYSSEMEELGIEFCWEHY